MARVPIVLAARARQAAPAAQALHGIPDRTQTPNVTVVDLFAEPAPPHATVQAPRPEPSHDDSVPSSPQPADAPKKTAPDRRKRLSQKAARAVADSARLVKGADHRETRRWDLITEDGTVLGYVEPSYGGTGRTGRNGSPPLTSAEERPRHWPLSGPQVFQHDRVQRGVSERLLFSHLVVAPRLVEILHLRVRHVDQEHGEVLTALLQQRLM